MCACCVVHWWIVFNIMLGARIATSSLIGITHTNIGTYFDREILYDSFFN